jgi:hypothetical protein
MDNGETAVRVRGGLVPPSSPETDPPLSASTQLLYDVGFPSRRRPRAHRC